MIHPEDRETNERSVGHRALHAKKPLCVCGHMKSEHRRGWFDTCKADGCYCEGYMTHEEAAWLQE